MVNRNEDSKRVPWAPVHDDGRGREPIAPSKPAVPAAPVRRESAFAPQPIEVEDADSDIIEAVTTPPPEEIMPARGPALWDAVPVFTPPMPAADAVADPIRSLGDAAVNQASLSASGAPTPLGGVTPSAASAPGSLSATPPPSAASTPGSSTPELDDNSPPFTPLFGAPGTDARASDSNDGDEPPGPAAARAPWWRSWPVLVIFGLLVMGGVAYAIIALLPEDEPVELTPEVIVPTPDEPTHEPISIQNPTAFQEVLPQMVGLYALTGHEDADTDNLELMVRVAEAHLLTYEYQDIMLAVSAFQHFDVESAIAQFEDIAGEGSDRAPVTAGETELGERVTITDGESVTIVWRNSTAIFSVTGPADAAEEFFTHSPL